jgi:hypothetical protein
MRSDRTRASRRFEDALRGKIDTDYRPKLGKSKEEIASILAVRFVKHTLDHSVRLHRTDSVG